MLLKCACNYAGLSGVSRGLASKGLVTVEDLRERLTVADMRQLGVKIGCAHRARAAHLRLLD